MSNHFSAGLNHWDLNRDQTRAPNRVSLNGREYLEFPHTGLSKTITLVTSLPSNWNSRILAVRVYWTSPATTVGQVSWGLRARNRPDTDESPVVGTVSYGPLHSIRDSHSGTPGDLNISVTRSLNFGILPPQTTMIQIELHRNVNDSQDSLNSVAYLRHVAIEWGRN